MTHFTCDQSRDIIGKQAEDDYILAPETHAQRYAESAPQFSALLGGHRFDAITKRYSENDTRAIEQQDKYKKHLTFANWAVLLTAIIGAGVMTLELISPGIPYETWIRRVLSMLGAISGVAGGMAIYKVREQNFLEKWMMARASAETARLDYFLALAKLGSEEPNTLLLPLIAHYFRRYQVEVQLNYYSKRRREHEQSASRSTTIGMIGTGISALAGVGAANDDWAAAGSLGVLGAAIIAYSVAREQLTQDRRNAERYGRTHETLLKVSETFGAVCAGAEQGNAAAVAEYVNAIQEQLSLEHRQWLDAGELYNDAIDRINASLSTDRQSGE